MAQVKALLDELQSREKVLFPDGFEGFRGQIMFYQAGIFLSNPCIDTDGNEQLRQQLMALIDSFRYGHARIRQMDVSTLVHGNVAVLSQIAHSH